MPLVECSHCGNQGRLADGAKLPTWVRCSNCGKAYQPVPVAEAAMAPAPKKNCPYCGEEILAIAKKCRHCGEIVDVALRAAEEAKAMARRRGSPAMPLVINNNVSTSSAASAAASSYARSGYRRRWWRSFARCASTGLGLLILGVILVAAKHDGAGATALVVGTFMLILVAPILFLLALTQSLWG